MNVEKTESELKARIAFYCAGHAIQVPVVTMHEQKWADCRGGYLDDQDGHAWAAIELANVNELKRRDVSRLSEPQRLVRRA